MARYQWAAASLALAMCLASPLPARAQTGATAEERTARYFDAVRTDPVRALMFLREMPKGGDLHSHLSGAIYAESYIRWAAEDGLCVDLQTGGFARPPCDAPERVPAAQALRSSRVHDQVVDALSVRNWHPARRSGHGQFFGSFDLFRLVSIRTGDMLAEATSRAALGHVSFLELMITAGGPSAGNVGASVGWHDDLEVLRSRLQQAGMADTVAAARRAMDAAEARWREVSRCGSADADSGCGVVVRYQYQVARAQPPEVVFAQLVAGFELAAQDPRFVGINMVQPEDHVVAMRDFRLHMQMISALKRHHPGVQVTLHAGELRSGLVPPEDLRYHIRESIETGHASRIGHGASIAHERHADSLLRDMAARGVLVEIALSSNDVILDLRGAEHPLRTYMAYGVPVALVTDDEGVLRSEMTMEFLKAVREHDLGYMELKQMARNSLEYAFVEGRSLWADYAAARRVAECSPAAAGDVWDEAPACTAFLSGNTRARLQAQLERAFRTVEQKYASEEAWTAR